MIMKSIFYNSFLNRFLLFPGRGCLIFFTFLVFAQCSTESDSDTGDQTESISAHQEEWIESRTGNIPLIISAPHGGTIKPNGIPDRSCSDAVTVRDMNTTELAYAIEQEFTTEYDVQPYIVAALISRSKVDLNRDLNPATCSNPVMMETWKEYHEQVENAIAEAVEKFGGAIFIDLHGHGHENQRLELGYLLTSSDLRQSYNNAESADSLAEKSSLRNLLAGKDELSLHEFLTGENALGTLMEEGGIPSVPSLNDPYPQSGEAYFTGGYNTRRYTSTDYPNVFGLQIEANRIGVRDTDQNRAVFAEVFAQSIMLHIDEYILN